MKSLKKVFALLIGLAVVALFVGGGVQNTNASVVNHQTAGKVIKTPTTPQIISKKIQGTWYFFDNKRQHKIIITGNTFKIDNENATVNKNGFMYYYADGIYQLGYRYSDNGYAFKTKVQRVKGHNVVTLQMISANFIGTNVLTQGRAYHFGAQEFF